MNRNQRLERMIAYADWRRKAMKEDPEMFTKESVYKKADEMKEKMKTEDERYTECTVCGKGRYGGIFMLSCDNYQCPLYNSFNMERCYICRQIRRDCCC